MDPILLALTLTMLFLSFGTANCDESNCNDCALTGKVYACLDEFTYGVCYDTDSVDPGSIKPCPNGYFCNTDDGLFCSAPGTSSPSCVPVTTTESSTESSTQSSDSPTTTAPEINPDKYCTDLKKTGYFRVESDPTCKDYVYCYLLSGELMGWLYHCNTNEYYNSKTSRCVTKRPDDC